MVANRLTWKAFRDVCVKHHTFICTFVHTTEYVYSKPSKNFVPEPPSAPRKSGTEGKGGINKELLNASKSQRTAEAASGALPSVE